jgi:hypothetical protein
MIPIMFSNAPSPLPPLTDSGPDLFFTHQMDTLPASSRLRCINTNLNGRMHLEKWMNPPKNHKIQPIAHLRNTTNISPRLHILGWDM